MLLLGQLSKLSQRSNAKKTLSIMEYPPTKEDLMPIIVGLVKITASAVIAYVVARVALRVWPITSAYPVIDQHSMKSKPAA